MSITTKKRKGTPANSTPLNCPFTHPDGDIIIQSCDGVKFQTFRVLLSLSSPVFKDMLSIPQPTGDEAKDGPPVVPVTEAADTLKTLLLLCYPGWMAKVNEDNVKVLADVLVAADKYEMEGIATQIEEFLLAPKLLECDALHVYAVACHYKLSKVAKTAAKNTLRVSPADWYYETYLEMISAGMLQKLYDYHKRCIERVEADIRAQFENHELKLQCSWCLEVYDIEDVLAKLKHRPWGGAVRETDIKHVSYCSFNCKSTSQDKGACAAEIRAIVEKTADEVEIDLGF